VERVDVYVEGGKTVIDTFTKGGDAAEGSV